MGSIRILFISRSKGGQPGSIILNQANSLEEKGINITHFLLTGKGFGSYLQNIFKLRKARKSDQFQIFHAHYSLSGIVALMAGCRPLITSLMGSDIYNSKSLKLFTKFFIKHLWNFTLVKSQRMQLDIGNTANAIIPNGVNLKRFRIISRSAAFDQCGLDSKKKNILFLANPSIPEKNFPVAKKSVELIPSDKNAQLIILTGVSNNLIPAYLNAADVLLMPSWWEGSPNAVKESLACNLPVVATAVGDVPELLTGLKGCYIVPNDPIEICSALTKAIENGRLQSGRERIINLGLDENSIADRLIKVYKQLIYENYN